MDHGNESGSGMEAEGTRANHPDFAVVAFDCAIGDFVFDESADAFSVAFESQCKLLEGFEGGIGVPSPTTGRI